MGFSFQADGREQGVFVPALLWEVNKENNRRYKCYTSNHK